MMKKYIKMIVIFSLLFCIAGLTGCGGEEGSKPEAKSEEATTSAPAADTGTSESEPVATVAGEYILEGEISNINTISNTFDLKTKDGKIPIQVRVMSRLMIDGERKALRDVKAGSHAKGTFKKWSGKDTVKEIVITR